MPAATLENPEHLQDQYELIYAAKAAELIPDINLDDAILIGKLAVCAEKFQASPYYDDTGFETTMETAFGFPKTAKKRLPNIAVETGTRNLDAETATLELANEALGSGIIHRFSASTMSRGLPEAGVAVRKSLARDVIFDRHLRTYQAEPNEQVFRRKMQGRALTIIALMAAGILSEKEVRNIPQNAYWAMGQKGMLK